MGILNQKWILPLAGIVFFTSCEKEEVLRPGRYFIDQIGLVNLNGNSGVDYEMQAYFDLSSGKMKASNKRDAWDLAFGCDANRPNIFVNSAMYQSVAVTGSTIFETVYNPSNFTFKYERSQDYLRRGRLMQDWASPDLGGQVYIINLSKTIDNQNRGYRKVQILDFDGIQYKIRIAKLDNSQDVIVEVPLQSNFNNIYLSVDDPGQILALEPPRDEWDIFFSKYMERLFDGNNDTLDYSVTGALLNPYQCEAYLHSANSNDSALDYSELKSEHIDPARFETRSDVIGHDWKYFDIDAGSYTVFPYMLYFVRDAEGRDYRLHFTGYYDQQGRKGGISFEYLPL